MRRRRGLHLGDPLFRSRRACRRIFGVDPGLDQGGDRLDHDAFDFATLALRRGLIRWLPPRSSVVEVGCGPSPMLTAWLHLQGHRVVAWEAHAASAARARRVLEQAFGEAAPTVHATAFDRHSPVDGTVVVANPPYVPTDRGLAMGLDPQRRHAWDGGQDGLQVVRALGHALRGRFHGELVLGSNRLFHRPDQVAAALDARLEDQAGLLPGRALRLAHP